MTVPTPLPHGADAPRRASGRVAPAPATAARDVRLAWVIGGSLLIAHAILPLITQAMYVPGLGIVSSLLWAGALAVFAFGVRGQGSVVARRPLGMTALVAGGLIPLAEFALWAVIPTESFPQGSLIPVGQGIRVVLLAALVIATVQIARAGVVPSRVRWLPLILVGVCAAMQAAAEAVAITEPGIVLALLPAYVFVTSVMPTIAALTLGIVAIVLAPRAGEGGGADTAVQVYPPSP